MRFLSGLSPRFPGRRPGGGLETVHPRRAHRSQVCSLSSPARVQRRMSFQGSPSIGQRPCHVCSVQSTDPSKRGGLDIDLTLKGSKYVFHRDLRAAGSLNIIPERAITLKTAIPLPVQCGMSACHHDRWALHWRLRFNMLNKKSNFS